MTVKQLKETIKDLPDIMDVFVDERLTEFKYGLVNSAKVSDIKFYESEYDGHVLCKETVLILSEE